VLRGTNGPKKHWQIDEMVEQCMTHGPKDKRSDAPDDGRAARTPVTVDKEPEGPSDQVDPGKERDGTRSPMATDEDPEPPDNADYVDGHNVGP
jgi:hypothetical protein